MKKLFNLFKKKEDMIEEDLPQMPNFNSASPSK